MEAYDPKHIEKKWQAKWEEDGIYRVDAQDTTKTPYYSLVEFPYPSGNLHVGHWYAFSVPDIRSRYLRMKGYNVLFPIGFDSFGLPAENAAIKRNLDPAAWTTSNMETMKAQLRNMGAIFDWDRLVATSEPAFYKWTQWMFARFFENDLVYQAETLVNWCPSCKTVLANEQVVNGECERCGATVEKKEMNQWMLRITKYADRLIDDLEALDWPKEIKEAQKNWIGRSEGAELYFEIKEEPKHFVFVHGYKSGPQLNFHQWLKGELESRGHTVEVPELPNTHEPDVLEQTKYVLENTTIDENTVLVGHSLGSNVVLRILERLDQPVRRTVLVGGFLDENFVQDIERNITFDFNFDIAAIKEKAGQLVLLHGNNEETISDDQFKYLHRTLGGEAIYGDDVVEHFRSSEEPAILRAVLPHITVFTTRPDTLYGATYAVLAPEHPLVPMLQDQAANWSEIDRYREQAAAKTDLDRQQSKEKTGVRLEGVAAIHPATKEEIPVFIADYVLAGYGTGAIMAVPAHDERDYEFAQAKGLPIKQVVMRHYGEKYEAPGRRDVVKAILLNNKNQVFLVQEHYGDTALWMFPGGSYDDPSHTDMETLRRELHEETGFLEYQIEDADPIVSQIYYEHPKKGELLRKVSTYIVRLKSESKEEHDELLVGKWFDIPEAITVMNTAHDGWINNPEADQLRDYHENIQFTGAGVLASSGEFSGLDSEEGKTKITEFVGGKMRTTYKQRDWGISRQRYWGTPIPIVYDPEGKPHVVPDEHLPWVLPTDVDHTPDGTAPLARSEELKKRTEEIFGAGWTPEVDTMDTFVDSTWYFMRYLDPTNADSFASTELLEKWLPVSMYSGGSEHTTMHVLYSRFWYKALADLGYVPGNEPYQVRMNRGLIMGPDGKKMSKSKGNVVDPDAEVDRFGADSIRTYLAFIGPYNEMGHYPWNTDGLAGVRRFLEKVWRIQTSVQAENNSDLEKVLHETIKKVSEGLEVFKTNTAVAQMMTCATQFDRAEHVGQEQYQQLLQILAPFAPHMTEELWSQYDQNSIHTSDWPEFNASVLVSDTVTIAIQVNGKLRDTVEASKDSSEDELRSLVFASEKVASYVPDQAVIKRFVVVPNKLVNIVV